ncbi:MAG: GTP-binding protein [Pseudomonadota bacterium]
MLTGLLSAGKTTLLNNLIRDPAASRIAVIMNEFGDVGLDHDLIEQVSGNIVLMHVGCLYCSIRGDLADHDPPAVTAKGGELVFGRLGIETTSIADPGPIVNTMVTDVLIADNCRLDAVVVAAGAAVESNTLDNPFEAVCQVDLVGLLVVTKSDLVTPDACAEFESRLAAISGSASRIRAVHGKPSARDLFGLSAMQPVADDGVLEAAATAILAFPQLFDFIGRWARVRRPKILVEFGHSVLGRRRIHCRIRR